MHRASLILVVSLVAVALGACGGSSSSGKAPVEAGGNPAVDAGCAAGPAGETIIGLQIKNVGSGCSVVVNGDVSFEGPDLLICQKAGTFDFSATPLAGFALGDDPWHDTLTESGGSASVTVASGAACVWVCCPGADGSPACPTTDQCP